MEIPIRQEPKTSSGRTVKKYESGEVEHHYLRNIVLVMRFNFSGWFSVTMATPFFFSRRIVSYFITTPQSWPIQACKTFRLIASLKPMPPVYSVP